MKVSPVLDLKECTIYAVEEISPQMRIKHSNTGWTLHGQHTGLEVGVY